MPHDLVTLFGKTHLSRSLKTAARVEALRAARKMAFEIELEFDRARASGNQPMVPRAEQTIQQDTVKLTMAAHVGRRTLEQAIDGYMTDPTRSPSPKSQAVYRTTYSTIAAILGEGTAVSDIGRDTCRDLLSVLQHLPSNAKKRFPALTPREAARHASAHGIAPMSVANVNEYMTKLSTLLNWACREEWISRNVASGLRLAVPASKAGKRKPFSVTQLRLIFDAPIYRGCRDDENGYAIHGLNRPRRSRFWIPLIGLYSGARLNEICQLHATDLREIDGVWCFDFHADPAVGKTLKTSASQRIVPIHPMLIKLGILAYLRDRKEAGDQRMFPEIAIDAFGLHSGRVSRWFSRFLATCGAAADGICYHSFRHSFRDALREAGIEREVALRLGGWSESGGSSNLVGDSYGAGFSAARLYTAISAINYAGLNLDHLGGPSEH
nr:site-specific integrase [Novosphingobium panipatense]